MQFDSSTGTTPKPHIVTTIISIITLIISALSLLSSIALLILTNTTVSGGDNPGIEMVGYIGLFMIGAFILALVGGIAGFIMTIVTLVVKNFKTVWMPIVSMVACIAAVIITVGAL